MSLLLHLTFTGCSFVQIDLPDRDHDEGDHPCDSGDTAETDTDTDTDSDTDTDTDADTDTGFGGPRWAPTAAVTTRESDDYAWVNGVWLTDMNHDGFDDLIVTTPTWDTTGTQLDVEFYASNGDGTLAAPVTLTTASGSDGSVPVLADVDDDGYPDLVYTRYYGYSLLGGSPTGFRAEVNWDLPADTYLTGSGAADVDGDGVQEIVFFEQDIYVGTADIVVFGQDSAGALGITHTYESYMSLYATSIAPVDFDGDGRETALFGDVYGTYGGDLGFDLLMYWGTEYPTLQSYPYTRFSADGTAFGFGEDINGDGQEELISSGTDGLQLYDPTVGHAEVLRLNDFVNFNVGLTDYDLDGDGAVDALELLYHSEYTDHSSYSAAGLSWVLQDDGGFTEAESAFYDVVPWGSGGHALSAGDVDGDGCGDVAFLNGYADVLLTFGDCGA